MNTLPESILLHAMSLTEGGVLSPKEFLHLGSRAAVDQALYRLTKEGKLLRVMRGTYVTPVSSRFGTRAPAPDKVVQALAAQSGEVVTPHGASAANALGLTQQVPIREVYLTSGRTRKLKLGRSEARKLGCGDEARAALDVGLGHGAGRCRSARLGMDGARAHRRIAGHLAPHPASVGMGRIGVRASGRAALPSWMAQAIGEEAVRG